MSGGGPERGSALIVTIFLVMALALLGLSLLSTTTTDLRVSDNYTRSIDSLYVTEAGANHAVSAMTAHPDFANIPADPSGTPVITGTLGRGTYSVWLWNQRVRAGGIVSPLPVAGSRQLVAIGTDGKKSSHRIEGIIEPVAGYPQALKRSLFSCGPIDLTNENLEGDIYGRGTVTLRENITGNVAAYGNFVFPGRQVTGRVASSSNIQNSPSGKVSDSCTAAGTIGAPGKCGSATAAAAPAPVADWCNPTTAPLEWDSTMLKLSPADLTRIRAATPAPSYHSPGWSVNTGSVALSGNNYVDGDVLFTSIDVTYTGETVLVVDGGKFTCDRCKVKLAGGAPATSNLSIITRSGDIVFTGTGGAIQSTMTGVLWAGVVDGVTMPAAGAVRVNNGHKLDLRGSAVAVGSNGIIAATELKVRPHPVKPTVFGEADAYRLTQWRDAR